MTIRLEEPKTKVKGQFVSADENGITVRLKDGTHQMIARDNVRKVTASHGTSTTETLIGAGAGAAVLAAMVGKEGDLTSTGKAVFIGAGAGLGALIGYGVHLARGSNLIYEPPRT